MKPTNPIAQLEQWKKNNEQGKINQFVNEMNQSKIGLVKGNKLNIEPVNQSNFGLVKNPAKVKFEQTNGRKNSPVTKSKNGLCENPQSESYSEPKKKLSFNPLHAEYAQISRQFKLIHDSNRKCLEVYPDEFHHKVKFRNELADLVVRLKTGGKLFNEMVKAQGAKLNSNNQETIRNFNQANDYLIHKFDEVIEQIEQLQAEHVNSVVLLKNEKNLIVSKGK